MTDGRDPTIEAVLAGRRALRCPVCSAVARPAGTVASRLSGGSFALATCDGCGFGFVVDPRTDFEALYDEAYYQGRGADPAVDYAAELQPGTIREREWDGIVRVVQSFGLGRGARWLDYGCGYGGLVRHARRVGFDASGYDLGHPAARAAELGTPLLTDADLDAAGDRFEVITAIEVLEHTLDPRRELARLAALLAPGGLLYPTTGNAARHRGDLARWRYVVPDVHISFFEPRTLTRLYDAVGLEPVPVGFRPGMTGIVAYKVLKSLGCKRRRWPQGLVPWSLVARAADRREGVSDQPAARRPAG